MATGPEVLRPRLMTYPVLGLSAVTGIFRWYWDFARKKPLGGIGLVLIVILAAVAIFGPMIAPRDELTIHPGDLFRKPQWTHGFILGADHLGRDVLSRIIIGARVSLFIAVFSVAAGSLAGWALGLLSGYYLGWVDTVIQRFVDMQMSIPGLVLALTIVSVLGRDQKWLILAIALTQVPSNARICRSVVLSVRTMEYVHAARALGASDSRIMFRHILPQTFAPWIVLVTASLGIAILIESSLSFLGLGTQPPKPSWGSMLSGPTLQNLERAPWNGVWPGLALSFAVFSFNLVGDSLRDVLDPRLRR